VIVSLSNRLWSVGAGLFFVWLGMAFVARGALVILGQPVFSRGVVVFGGVLVLAGVMPSSWIVKLARTPQSKAKSIESAPLQGRRRKDHPRGQDQDGTMGG
jgi:hypothetical protein